MPASDAERIRAIFLHARPFVTIGEASALLGWSCETITRALAGGELESAAGAPFGGVTKRELMAKALEIWGIEDIEAALGRRADRILPALVRSTELLVRVPRYQVVALEHVAAIERRSVGSMVASQLDVFVDEHRVELRDAIPRLDVSLDWPG